MNLNLTDKTAVVTGAGRGIGLATVRTLIGEGVRVVGADRSISPELKETGAHPVSADLSTAEGVSTVIETAVAELGGIDLLVNNVGGTNGTANYAFLDNDDATWSGVFDINVLSTVRAVRAALPSLIERRGAIVNVASTVAQIPSSGPGPYSASKAAVTALGKALSEEFGPQGVRVNTVSPGLVHTAAYEDPEGPAVAMAAALGLTPAEFVQKLVDDLHVTSGRMSRPEEIATLIAFLLSDVAGNITGANYVIDGGTIKTV
ncbi:SDR family NAD(P)-dependent oxidoreductase [Streptomyces sp. NPDC090499]|uniref:SDR family NAD(P)-dependent oxidoreductase n=1 Tax=Streptomyces sp. NPDC090499 TaxID=3365965 RepID=UPI0038006168